MVAILILLSGITLGFGLSVSVMMWVFGDGVPEALRIARESMETNRRIAKDALEKYEEAIIMCRSANVELVKARDTMQGFESKQ